ncbi:MAG: NDP-sugar synthase [Candidatus Rokubacteria bacterium]|nr:NDP-sugar synthase [Candidatus Rokubacteria bacterium]
MQAVILAGGQGTRLRPLTLSRAKSVVPLLNRPFLAYQLALLREHGVGDVILSCSYRVDDVRRTLGDGTSAGVRLRYVVEAEPLGTGGGVRNAADLAAGPVFVLNGDVLTDVDLAAMRRFHEKHGSRTTIFLMRVDDPRPYGLVEMDDEGRLRGFREKPTTAEEITTDTVNAGVYLIDGELLRRIPSDRAVSIEREFFPALIADGIPCFGWCVPAYWRDIGSPGAYRAAQIDLLEGRVRTGLHPPGDRRGESWIEAGGSAATDARVEAPSVVGPGVELHAGCHVGPLSVIGEHSRIGARARVERAVLWERVDVGEGAMLRDCVVGADVRIGAHAEIGANVVLESGAVIPERTRLRS